MAFIASKLLPSVRVGILSCRTRFIATSCYRFPVQNSFALPARITCFGAPGESAEFLQVRLFRTGPRLMDSSDSRVPEEKSAADGKTSEVSSGKSSQKERLKKAVRDYGATVIVFHVCISLFTLGVSYAAVSTGLDVVGLLEKLGVGQSILDSKVVTGGSTFVIAYAVHKVFAPARIACTVTATPFIVRYLRRIGFLKTPPPVKP